jgi:hypothetical protein
MVKIDTPCNGRITWFKLFNTLTVFSHVEEYYLFVKAADSLYYTEVRNRTQPDYWTEITLDGTPIRDIYRDAAIAMGALTNSFNFYFVYMSGAIYHLIGRDLRQEPVPSHVTEIARNVVDESTILIGGGSRLDEYIDFRDITSSPHDKIENLSFNVLEILIVRHGNTVEFHGTTIDDVTDKITFKKVKEYQLVSKCFCDVTHKVIIMLHEDNVLRLVSVGTSGNHPVVREVIFNYMKDVVYNQNMFTYFISDDQLRKVHSDHIANPSLLSKLFGWYSTFESYVPEDAILSTINLNQGRCTKSANH